MKKPADRLLNLSLILSCLAQLTSAQFPYRHGAYNTNNTIPYKEPISIAGLSTILILIFGALLFCISVCLYKNDNNERPQETSLLTFFPQTSNPQAHERSETPLPSFTETPINVISTEESNSSFSQSIYTV